MRVCLVSSFYPPFVGGAETYVSNLARNLVVMGHEVTVLCSRTPLAQGITVDEGVQVVRMRVPVFFYGTPLAIFPASFARGDYDVLHCNFPSPYFTAVTAGISKLRGIPSVLTWHNDLPAVTRAASALVGLSNIASVAYLAPYSKIIATTSIYARNSKMLRREEKKVEVVPNGVDTAKFNPDVDCEWVKEKYHLKGCKTLIFVGALTTWHTYKGLEELLRAFALIRSKCENLKVLVVGGGNLMGYYQQLAKQLLGGERVVFAGYVDDNALPACYAASDFAVLPSRDSSEGFGLVLLEAMACGLAVIGSAVGGIPEIVKEWTNGILVEPRDPQGLAKAVHSLYMDDELRRRLGKGGRRFAESHDWRVVAGRVSSLYREIV